jgi:hypothetical protein
MACRNKGPKHHSGDSYQLAERVPRFEEQEGVIAGCVVVPAARTPESSVSDWRDAADVRRRAY